MDNNQNKNEAVNIVGNKEEQTPQVIEIKPNSEEVKQNPSLNQEKKEPKKKEKHGHPVFLTLLIIFLFAFVYFLPEITSFITEYRNKKSGINELKSGMMVCNYETNSNDINYNYKINFKYQKNRLKESTITTTFRLSDTAINNNFLVEKENSCQLLKLVLDEQDIGMKINCNMSAALQTTTQTIDYKKLNIEFISENIKEFDGFYPKYELNENMTVIQKELETTGYKCIRNEK